MEIAGCLEMQIKDNEKKEDDVSENRYQKPSYETGGEHILSVFIIGKLRI